MLVVLTTLPEIREPDYHPHNPHISSIVFNTTACCLSACKDVCLLCFLTGNYSPEAEPSFKYIHLPPLTLTAAHTKPKAAPSCTLSFSSLHQGLARVDRLVYSVERHPAFWWEDKLKERDGWEEWVSRGRYRMELDGVESGRSPRELIESIYRPLLNLWGNESVRPT